MVESALESSDSERELLVIGDNPLSMSFNSRAGGQECRVSHKQKDIMDIFVKVMLHLS